MIRLVSITNRDDPLLPMFKRLVRLYLVELGVDISFQGVEKELDELPGKFAPSAGGCMYLFIDDQSDDPSTQPSDQVIPVGCIALRDFGDGVGEVKRMFTDSAYRGRGIGKQMINAVIEFACKATIDQTQPSTNQSVYRFNKLRLDTLVRLKAANQLYQSLGFYPIDAYCVNPIEDVVFYEYDLDRLRSTDQSI